MNKRNGLKSLLLNKGEKTSLEELNQNYQGLQNFAHTDSDKMKLQSEYLEVKESLEKDLKSERKEFIEKIREKQKNNSYQSSMGYIIDLVNTIQSSICYRPAKYGKRRKIEVGSTYLVRSGSLQYRGPFGVANYLDSYAIQNQIENPYRPFFAEIQIASLEDDKEYQDVVVYDLLDKNNIEQATNERAGYLGVVRKDEKGKWKVEIDSEQMAACLAYQNRPIIPNREKKEKGER